MKARLKMFLLHESCIVLPNNRTTLYKYHEYCLFRKALVKHPLSTCILFDGINSRTLNMQHSPIYIIIYEILRIQKFNCVLNLVLLIMEDIYSGLCMEGKMSLIQHNFYFGHVGRYTASYEDIIAFQ